MVVAGVLVAVAAVVATGVVLSARYRKSTLAAPPPATTHLPAAVTVPTTTCVPLLYQACGQTSPAPGTDGSNCLPGRADFDAVLANGCEAISDYQSGQDLVAGQAVAANLVPADAVDSYTAEVSQSVFNLCLTKFRVTLTAPPGTTEKVEIVDNGRVLASATSSNLEPGTASAAKPSCFASGPVPVTIRVTTVAGHSAEDFRLVSGGGW